MSESKIVSRDEAEEIVFNSIKKNYEALTKEELIKIITSKHELELDKISDAELGSRLSNSTLGKIQMDTTPVEFTVEDIMAVKVKRKVMARSYSDAERVADQKNPEIKDIHSFVYDYSEELEIEVGDRRVYRV